MTSWTIQRFVQQAPILLGNDAHLLDTAGVVAGAFAEPRP